MPTIPVGAWAPDQPPLGNPGALTAQNVYPAEQTYRPVRNLQGQVSALPARVRGASIATDPNQNVVIVAGTLAALFVSTGLDFQDVSQVGGYTTTADQRWEFASFASRVIATNFADAVQVKDLADPIDTDFADLFTSTLRPTARHIAVVSAFLMMGNTNDAVDGPEPDRLWWTAFRDPTDADPDSATQSNFIPLIGGGAIQRVVGGAEYAVVFQERQISRAQYVGGGAGSPIFDVIPIDRGRGTPVPGSVASRGREVFFYSEDGFRYFDGSQSYPIGDERVDRQFAARFDVNNRDKVFSAIDPENKLYAILFPGQGETDIGSEIFFYHWPSQRWAETEEVAEVIFDSSTQSLNVDSGLTDFANIDTSPFASVSIDSPQFQGGAVRLGAFDESHVFSLFSGSTKQALVDTQERQLIPNRLSLVSKVRPLVEGGAPRIQVLWRDDLASTPVTTSAAMTESDGQVDAHITARYHRFRIRMEAGDEDWSHIQGVQIEDDQIQDMGVQ